MVANVLFAGLKEVRHVQLSKPDDFILEFHLDFGLTVFGLIDQDLRRFWQLLFLGYAVRFFAGGGSCKVILYN